MTQMLPFSGQVLFRDRPTTDGRRFAADANLTWRDTPIRVFAPDVVTGEVVGEISWVEDRGSYLTVSGVVALDPGDYPCGVNVDNVEVAVPTNPSDEDIAEMLFGGDERYTAGRIASLTVYTDGTESAWPGCHITVQAWAESDTGLSDRMGEGAQS